MNECPRIGYLFHCSRIAAGQASVQASGLLLSFRLPTLVWL